jgi:hypothetical protein
MGTVGPFLKSLRPPELKPLVVVAVLKIIAQVRQGNASDPDMLRALTAMEIVMSQQFSPLPVATPAQSAYDTPT